jgi:hypothetical protein
MTSKYTTRTIGFALAILLFTPGARTYLGSCILNVCKLCSDSSFPLSFMRELIQNSKELLDKSMAQTYRAAVIPRGNLNNVSLCFRS